MSLFAFPRMVQNEFSGAFRLLDELAAASRQTGYTQATRTFAPRFSFRENKDNYELKGELPGVDSKNVEIEFTDDSTLSIRGRVESHHEEGEPMTSGQPVAIENQSQSKDTDSESSYHKATVEEEGGATATPTESAVTTTQASQEVAQAPKESHYYYSERSFGEFARTFNFPRGTVDAEHVKASLKDGILSIVVPKQAKGPASRKITVE